MSDEQLVLQYLSGQECALEELVARYLKPIYNFAYQLVQDKQVAEDITQDVFVKFWAHAKSFDPNKKFSTWLFAIAKNTALDFLRKKNPVPFISFENEDGSNILEFVEDDKSFSSEEILKMMDARKDVAQLLASLPVISKTILLLHHKHGFQLTEIAEILGQSSNTVKSKYRRAILQLRAQALGGSKIKLKPSQTNALF